MPLIINYRISDLHFNITPPSLITTMASDKSATNVSASELSLVINKAESIEEKGCEIEASTESLHRQRQLRKDSGDVIDEIINVPVMSCERKASIAERQKSVDKQEVIADVQPSLPTSISTQTLPTEEFPEELPTGIAIINQDANKMDSTSATQLERQTAPEIDRKTKGIKKAKSRSIEDKERKAPCGGKMSVEEDDERRHHKCYKLTHQQSQVSQEEDLEITMSELLPGCVGECWTSNFLNYVIYISLIHFKSARTHSSSINRTIS